MRATTRTHIFHCTIFPFLAHYAFSYMQSCVLRPHKSYVCLISSTQSDSPWTLKKVIMYCMSIMRWTKWLRTKMLEVFFSKEEAIVSAVLLMHGGQYYLETKWFWKKYFKLLYFLNLMKLYKISQIFDEFLWHT